jgi:uncharacterized protein
MTASAAILTLHLVISTMSAAPEPVPVQGEYTMDSIHKAQWLFGGELGQRIDANVENWLLRAPDTNPGLIEMFRRRDRHWPHDTPVPWAGEFAGKYLISAVQACRMTSDARLEPFVAQFVKELVASQDDDGYLGPWRRDERLLGHWDLWGHYHCMLGLLMWYDRNGDDSAYQCAIRAADCMCDIYIEGRRPVEAGTPQINLAVLHVMGNLYRRTSNERYLTLMRRIEEDMATDGDWLRLGEKGVPYHKLPGGGTRWESLHIVQGIVELYLITGEERYKTAAVNLWKSIRDDDRHPSGAFSTHESAVGTVYAPGAIETCCSIAWEALTIDVLKLTGDSTVADELELTTWNEMLASQHPSGSWWTYNTPLDGVRVPSFQDIRFQYRPGTPELNCCSVNAPRGLGMLSEWAVMADGKDVVVNFYGPGESVILRGNGEGVILVQDTEYPVEPKVVLTLTPEKESEFTVRLRIPEWSKETSILVNGTWTGPEPEAGTYLDVKRNWVAGDQIELTFDMSPRHWAGRDGRHAHAALYTGPILLAFDAFHNEIETANLPAIDMGKVELEQATVEMKRVPGYFPPMGLWKCPAADGTELTLCDFATAGAHGTDYVAWLPAANVPPPPVTLRVPEEDTVGRPGPVLFCWKAPATGDYACELVVSRDKAMPDVVVHKKDISEGFVTIEEGLQEPGAYYWSVLSVNAQGSAVNYGGPRAFRVDASADHPFFTIGADGLMAASALDGDGTPSFGVCVHQQGLKPAADRHGKANGAVAFDGSKSELRYALPFLPESDYTFCAWVCPEGLPVKGLQQVFSAWCKSGDDPLRVTFDGDKLFARIESPAGGTSTKGVQFRNGKWVHVAAVKEGGTLSLYVNGALAQSAHAAAQVITESTDIGIGYNPLFSGGEHFRGKLDDFTFHGRALSAEVLRSATRGKSPGV